MKPIYVIGAGVAGLTTALSIVRAGYPVVVVARELWKETTSGVAAAFWYPYRAFPPEKVEQWGAVTFGLFADLAAYPDSGVKWWRFVELTAGVQSPWWADVVKNFAPAAADELPPGAAQGVAFDNLTIDSSVYMPYLERELVAAGGKLVVREIQALSQLFGECDIVVNCSGLGARLLANDSDLHAARGQVVKVKRKPEDRPLMNVGSQTKFAHCIPRGADTVLGGTYEDNSESLEPSVAETAAIIDRCSGLLPRLASLSAHEIIETSCGLRPVRSAIRLDCESPAKNKFVIHNYGHGGAGYSLSWGCAADVVKIITDLSQNHQAKVSSSNQTA